MASTRVLFVPWPRSMGEVIEQYTTFEKNIRVPSSPTAPVRLKDPSKPLSGAGLEYAYKNKVWRDSDTARGKSFFEVWYTGTPSIILMGLVGNDNAVYVRGHSLPGSPSIFTKTGGKDQHLLASEVADRLIESGLQTTFVGTIKCYNCHSAEPIGSDDAFAQRLANDLWHRGYTNCRFEGYMGALDSHPANDGHKYSTNGGRASANQVQIHPH